MAKKVSPVIYLGVAAAILAAYTFLSAPQTTAPKRANNTFQGGARSQSKTTELFRPEDYTASFPAVNVAPRDAFKPLVAKTTKTLTGQVTPLLPNGIPAAFAGGDGNWIYTGNAEVDGVPNALLENTATQDGVFLRPGERWKSLTLARVTSNQIELIGPTGQRHSVRIADETATEKPVAVATTSAGTLPAAVPDGRGVLAGPIGADPNAQNLPSDGSRPNRGGRRNRRNNNNQSNANSAPTFGTP